MITMYKKVLLRERKRHTARRVASARYVALSNGGGDTPSSPGRGGTPPTIQTWPGGYPPHHPDLAGGGNPPPCPDLGWGTPPPVQVWTDTQSQNIIFPHPSDAGGKRKCIENSAFLGSFTIYLLTLSDSSTDSNVGMSSTLSIRCSKWI